MTEVRANFLMDNRAVAAGITMKWIDDSVIDEPRSQAVNVLSAIPSVDVYLSSTAVQITDLLRRPPSNNASAAEGFDRFLESLHQQVSTQGKEAEVLKELPESQTPQRIALSMQATNYLLTSLYGVEKLHEKVTVTDPFSGLDRLSLSNIAFDVSGAFTSVERQVAFLDLTDRDIAFRNQTFDLPDQLKGGDFKAQWIQLASYLRDAQLSSGMSEGERLWRGWMPATALYAHAQQIMERRGVEDVDFPAYSNLKSTGDGVLVSVVDKAGVSRWINIPDEQLITRGVALGLIESITEYSNLDRVNVTDGTSQSRHRLLLYSIIDSYQ